MKLLSRLGTNTLSLVFFSIFFSLSLIFVTESMALNNASLNGTYGYVVKGSLFTGLDGNGGFGQNDEEFVQYGDIVFDGAGGCTDLGPTENRITRSILETPGLSNTFTTGHVETVSSAIPCTYTVSLDGPMTITFAPGTPDEITLAGMLSGDRGTLLFHHVSDIPNDVLGTLVVTAVKKGVGMSNASLNGSFAVAGRWSGFEGADINGGFGGNDTEGLRREEFTFDGAGGCTNSVIAEDFLTRSIGEIAHSNTFTTLYAPGSPSSAACTYNVAGDGALTITLPGEIAAGTVSVDGRTLLLSGVVVIPVDTYGVWMSVGVKKGTGMNNASVRGNYTWVGEESAFIDNDINGGFGKTDIEGINTGGYTTFDGAGGCTMSLPLDDNIARSIGETPAFSNTFVTTLSTGSPPPSGSCVYDVAPDGTITITTNPGTPDEFINTGIIREDGSMGLSYLVQVRPDWKGLSLSMMVRSARPSPDIKANGSDGPITITRADNLNITVSLEPGNFSGTNADWWVLADTPFGWYRYNVGTDSWVPGEDVTYQGPIRDLPAREVLNRTGLPAGTYTLSFEVDLTRNGVKDAPIYSDSVEVTVTP